MSSSTADTPPTAPDGGPDPFADLAPNAPDADAATEPDDDDSDDEPDGADDLGDKGKQALERMKGKLKAERAKRRAAEEKLTSKPAGDKPADDAIESARREAAAEATAKANGRILRSEVKAAAAGKLADPTDALRLLDLDQFEVSEDGDVDADEISEAIDDLIKSKPYLAAQGGTTKAPKPDRSQGARGNGAASTAQQFADAVPL